MDVKSTLKFLLVRFMKLRKAAYINDNYKDFAKYTKLANNVELILKEL